MGRSKSRKTQLAAGHGWRSQPDHKILVLGRGAVRLEERVRAELAQSHEDLQRELGVADPLFADPYGGRQNMTPQRLELVKQAGFSGCLSAYGGSNVGSVDRYNVMRRGIHWEFSDGAFMLECLGLT